VNGNVAWLSLCAQRWLSMKDVSLSEICYDSNPPLSILLYAPSHYLSSLTGSEEYYAIYASALTLIAVCCIIIFNIARNFSFFSPCERLLILACYILSVTITSSISFADKDHIIAILLLPFSLTQLSMTWRFHLHTALKYTALSLGSLAIMIKPHFIILPLLFLSHRAWTQKRWQVVFDPDSILLIAFSLLYAAVLIIFFQDFLTTVLPDIVLYYLPYNNEQKTYSDIGKIGIWIMAALTLAALTIEKEKKYKSQFLFLLIAGAIIGLAVYYLQMKGLDYQLLPLFPFIFVSFALGIHNVINKYIPKLSEPVICVAIILIGCSFAYYRTPLRANYPSHDDYKNSDLAKFIEQNCGNPCSFMITHENMEISSQIGFYVKGTYATRFPGYWFIPVMEGTAFPDKGNANLSPLLHKQRQHFASYVSDDLSKFKPSLIMVLTTPAQGSSKPAFDYFDYFSIEPKFKDLAENYHFVEQFSTDRGYFFRDTRHGYRYILTWDVYKLKEK